jgi:predicted dehydrogenase
MAVTTPRLRVAVVGYGYWGPNLVRNVAERPELEFAGLCELDPERRAAFSARMPGAPVFEDLQQVLEDSTIDALLVATPPRTHHAIAKRALHAGLHVLVEKPLAKTAAEARDLITLADANGLVLMPGHTFLYSPPVNKVKELVASEALGEIYFVTSSRMNLGKTCRSCSTCSTSRSSRSAPRRAACSRAASPRRRSSR